MPLSQDEITRFLKSVHPYDALPSDDVDDLAKQIEVWELDEDSAIYEHGQTMPGVFVIYEGQVEISDINGAIVSHLGLRNSFGERGLLRDGKAATKSPCAYTLGSDPPAPGTGEAVDRSARRCF